MTGDVYTVKDMQQIMMVEQKCQRDILEGQNHVLDSINQHLLTLNGKVARHQEILIEKDRGIMDRVGSLETWKFQVVGGAIVLSSVSTVLVQLAFKLFF